MTKYELPTEPSVGASVTAGGVTFTRKTGKSGDALMTDAWYNGDGKPRTWAELFVIGNGEVSDVASNLTKVRALVTEALGVSGDSSRVDAVVAALVETPHVNTGGVSKVPAVKAMVGEVVGKDNVSTLSPEWLASVEEFTDKDGDRHYRSTSVEGNWALHMDGPSNSGRTLARGVELWGPFMVSTVK